MRSEKRGMKINERNSYADTKGSEGGGEGASAAEMPLQAVQKTMIRQLCPWGSWRSRGSRYPPALSGGPPVTAGGCLKEAVNSWEAHTGAGFWQDL